ncbi:MAG TPA: superoxide dismutase [Cu-Zn] SodC [Syntrophales bacterium]|nr:superoxide dismutase [Cu-Zn] SodC [Syntrophales bacterium]
MKKMVCAVIVFICMTGYVFADQITVQMNLVNEKGVGKNIGTVTAMDSRYGLILIPELRDLTPGIHGFHVHQLPYCGAAEKEGKHVAALAAGGHFDPYGTNRHEGPYGEGHLGDLPFLYVGPDGKAVSPVLAPRLKVEDLKERSLMIHAGGDNYSDSPEALGGGGARVACGVIK